jgi:hypothetical protein
MTSFNVNFTSGVLDPRINFSRAGNTATVINSSGFVAPVNANIARFDYDPVTLNCKGLLIEESRQNLFTYSADLTDASWDFTGTARTANAGVAPDNTNTATRVQFSANSFLFKNGVPAAGTNFTISVWVKSYSGTAQTIRLFGNGVTTLSSNISVNASWQRVTFTFTFSAATSGFTTASGQTADVLMWGAQLEAGSFATSYIPTTSAAVTRNADVATITGSNFSDFWQANKGGTTAQVIPSTVSGISPLVQYDDGTANEIIALRGNTTNPELYIVDGGATQAQLDAGTIVANTAYSLTGWWETNDCKARQDSGAVVTDTTATIPTVTQARLGSDGTNYLNGHLATVTYYDTFFGQPIYTRRKNKVVSSLL